MFVEDTAYAGRRMWTSTLMSAALYGGLVAGAFVLSKAAPQVLEAPLEVVFRSAPPAPPPAPAHAKPAVPKPSKPKLVLALVAPTQVSDKKLEEAAPAPVEVEAPPAAAAQDSGAMHAAPARASRDPIQLPENATPPVAAAGNTSPEFPESARAQGLEGQVILKIVVDDRGRVTRVDVMKGEEPFVSAALAAVKTWTYSPALVDGQPTSVFRIVKIPFRLRG